MIPATYNLGTNADGSNASIYQGDSWSLPLRIKNPDGFYITLTGYVGKAQIRVAADTNTALAEISCTNAADQVTNIGVITLTLTPTQTAAIRAGSAVWDFQLTTPTGEVDTYLAGTVTILAEVTRP